MKKFNLTSTQIDWLEGCMKAAIRQGMHPNDIEYTENLIKNLQQQEANQ